MEKNILNKIIIEWNNSDIEDSGLLKASGITNKMNYQLVYKLDIPRRIKVFDSHWTDFNKLRDKVYINDEHVELNGRGFTENEYKPGEYHVYIDGFDECEEIGRYAFNCCTGLNSVTIPNSVKKINTSAFEYCTGLNSVTIPNSVMIIGQGAFSKCYELISITIPNSVTSIGYAAFSQCTDLTSIIIPNSVESIDGYAFYGCKNLKTVYVENIDKFNKIKFNSSNSSNPTYYGAKLIELKR